MQPFLKPRRLAPGDKVIAVSSSWGGPGAFPHRYLAGKRQMEEVFGLRVVESRHALADPAWLAANPQARADDLMEAFADTSADGIVSSIGGDDSIRLLPYLDVAMLRRNAKVFLGFSDTTVTHMACFAAGIVSFYGPSVMAGFAENGGMYGYTVRSLRKTVFSAAPAGLVEPNGEGWTDEYLDWADPAYQSVHRKLRPASGWQWLQGRGRVRGRLAGGCLEVLDWLRGTPVWPRREAWRECILFLETSEERPAPAAVVRMLRALAASGALAEVRAVLLGRPYGPGEHHDAYDRALLQVLRDELGREQVPVVTRMDFGHTDPVFVMPCGVEAEVDCEARTFSIVESAVT